VAYEAYFPRGIAAAEAFCNRVLERKRLAHNIETGQHTLLISPRRYGKTSLVNYVMQELHYPVGDADLFVAVDANHVEQKILASIKTIMKAVCSSTEQLLSLLRNYFSALETQWTIGTQGVNLVLQPNSSDGNVSTHIMNALLALEHLLQKKNKRAIIFLDEMQEIGSIEGGKSIEGAIRHVAQQSKQLSFVFSGSNRHLLQTMFFDKSRPLYKLCDKIKLERIHATDYVSHLKELAMKRWDCSLSEEALNAILSLTERHPYYVNSLCLRLWESDLSSPPTPKNIESMWLTFAAEEQLGIQQEFSKLNNSQQKVLIAIATGYNRRLTGKEFLQHINLSSSSVTAAIKHLKEQDYIQLLDDEYYLIDPLMTTVLSGVFR